VIVGETVSSLSGSGDKGSSKTRNSGNKNLGDTLNAGTEGKTNKIADDKSSNSSSRKRASQSQSKRKRSVEYVDDNYEHDNFTPHNYEMNTQTSGNSSTSTTNIAGFNSSFTTVVSAEARSSTMPSTTTVIHTPQTGLLTSETSIAAVSRNDITEAYLTRTLACKEEYHLSHYAHLKQLQDEDFAFALADKRMKNRLTLAAQQEQLDRFNGSKTLGDASLRIQEKRLLSDADNAYAISNAKSRDIVRTLDAPAQQWARTPRGHYEHREERYRNSSSRNSVDSSRSGRAHYENNSRHDFSYQSEFVAFEVERKRVEHDIIIAQRKKDLEIIKSSTTTSVRDDVATPRDATNQQESAQDHGQHQGRCRSPGRYGETSYSSYRRESSRSRSHDSRYYENSNSRRRSRSRSYSRCRETYSNSRRRSRSRSPNESYNKHSNSRRRRSWSPSAGRHRENNFSSRRRSRSRSPAGGWNDGITSSHQYTNHHDKDYHWEDANNSQSSSHRSAFQHRVHIAEKVSQSKR
jgi:hypothetical protein